MGTSLGFGPFRRLVLLGVLGLGLAACAQQMGGTDFPQASAGFSPRGTYPVASQAAWSGVIAALNDNHITVASSSVETGQISTDYIEGPGTLYALGLIASGNSRYKFTIFLTPQGRSRTKIDVNCVLESSMLGDSGATPFHQVNGDNPQIIERLKGWMYEQIERHMG